MEFVYKKLKKLNREKKQRRRVYIELFSFKKKSNLGTKFHKMITKESKWIFID